MERQAANSLLTRGVRAHTLNFQVQNHSYISLVRTIFVAAGKRLKNRQKPTTKRTPEDKLQKWAVDDTHRHNLDREEEYKKKLREIQSLTKSVARIVKLKEDQKKQRELIEEIPMPSHIDKEAEKLYKSLESGAKFNPQSTSLLTPVVDIPDSIQQRLGLSVKFLVSKDKQNWPLVLETLRSGGGFKELKEKDVRKLLYNIPKEHIAEIIPQVESLMQEAEMAPSSKILNVYIKGLSMGRDVPEETLEMIESYAYKIREMNNGNLSRDVFETMITAYGKANKIDKINNLLAEMKDLDLRPSPYIYSNVLKTLVYKSKNHKEAVSIFDSMKFLSQETRPGTDAYKDVIVSYVNNDDIEKSLDLYQEMLKSRTPVNQEVLVALAKGCANRKQLRFKAWEFMFEIYDNKWTPTLETLEYMIFLSSKDGDVALSRALYKKLVSTNSVTARAFNFLLMAYSKSRALKSETDPPVVTMSYRGRNLRANILQQAQLPFKETDPRTQIPFLPKVDILSSKEIMAESSALWAHTLIFNQQFINLDTYNSYLNVAAEFGTKDELLDRYHFSKISRDAPTNTTRVVVEEPEEIDPELENIIEETQRSDEAPSMEVTKSPLLRDLDTVPTTIEITRNTMSYLIALKGAGRLKDYKFAQDIWIERGRYRKSQEFKTLPRKEKDRWDFEFAQQMVHSLTTMNLLDDALAVVVSTEYQFKWSWAQLNVLYRKCSDIGQDRYCRTLRSIASRAQIRFEGKIRRRDYKEYVMKRGY